MLTSLAHQPTSSISSGGRVVAVLPGISLCLALTGAAYALEAGERALAGKAWLEALVLADRIQVACDVCGEFSGPEVMACFWRGGFLASRVAMPKAPMDEYRQSESWKDDIRFAGEVFSMDAEAKA